MRSGFRKLVKGLGNRRGGVGDRAEFRRANIAITGPGRSGTTLTCHLLNKLPNTIALSEPIAPGRFADRLPDHEAVCDGIEGFYQGQRESALKRGLVVSKHVGGVVPDNSKGMVDGVRQRVAEKGEIAVEKELSDDFYLAIKMVGFFTALVPTLAERFRCYAIIRNPLAIRASSLSINSHRTERKNPPALVRYDGEIDRQLKEGRERNLDAVDMWLLRTHYTFDRYQKSLAPENIIRYEDIVATKGRALEVIVPAAGELDEPLESKNLNPLYDREDMPRIGEGPLASDGAYWYFYSREDVEALLEQLRWSFLAVGA